MCVRVARRDGARVFSYGPGGGYEPLRQWVAARYGVEPGRVVLTVGGLQGFVFYAAEQLARRPGRVLVEAPSYDRPLKILAREGAEIVALEMDDEGLDPEALKAELRGRTIQRLPSSTRSRRSRTRAGERSPPSRVRGSSRSSASTGSQSSRTTRTASCASRERPRRRFSSSKVGSWSPTRRPSRRRSLRACARGYFVLRLTTRDPSRSAPSRRTSRRRSCRRPSSPSSSHAVTSSRTCSVSAVSCSRAATRCSPRSPRARTARRLVVEHIRRAATSSGSTSTPPTRPSLARRTRRGRASTFVAGEALLPSGLSGGSECRRPCVQLRELRSASPRACSACGVCSG